MLTLPQTVATVIGAFAPMFSKRLFEHAKLLLVGAILAPGKRTVTSALRVMGRSHDQHFQNYHRVLNRARWTMLRGGRILLQWLLCAFAPTGPLVIGIDETIERRRGERMAAKGIYRDPVRSSPAHFVKASGVRWVCLRLLAPVPWSPRAWGWPFLTLLSPSERDDQQRGRSPRTLLDRARHAVWRVRRWLPARELVVVGDSTDAALEWLDAVRTAQGQRLAVIAAASRDGRVLHLGRDMRRAGVMAGRGWQPTRTEGPQGGASPWGAPIFLPPGARWRTQEGCRLTRWAQAPGDRRPRAEAGRPRIPSTPALGQSPGRGARTRCER